MLEAIKKVSKVEVDQTSTSTSKAGPRKQAAELSNLNTQPNLYASDHSDDHEHIEMDFCGPSLPSRFGQSAQSDHGTDPNKLDHHSEQSEQPEWVCLARARRHSDKKKHNVRAKYISHSLSP